MGFVARSHDLLVPGERSSEEGFYAGFTLDRHPVLKILKSPLYLESRLDFFLTELAGQRIKELIWTNKLAFTLMDRLFLTVNHEFYVYDTGRNNVNLASNLTVGIQFLMDYRYQTL